MKKYLFPIVIVLFSVFVFSCDKDEDESPVVEDIYYNWEVVDFMSIESMLYSKDNNYNPRIEFKQDGSFNIKLDINSCSGSFEIKPDNQIAISLVVCTEACCDSDFSTKFAAMLSRVESYDLEDDQLRLDVPAWGFINLKLK